MASNQTQNYGLSQWELTDDVRMEDFNADNAKIDAALASKYGTDKQPFVVGNYTGTGEVGTALRIDLGFPPSAVIVIGRGLFGLAGRSGDTAIDASPFDRGTNNVLGFTSNCLSLTDTGFSLVKAYSSYDATLNDAEQSYVYIALP